MFGQMHHRAFYAMLSPRSAMTTAWLLGSVSLFVTTVGALLIFLYLCNTPASADAWNSSVGKNSYPKHRRMLILSMGLLSAWLLVQYLAVILI
jgi:hypothetical protein